MLETIEILVGLVVLVSLAPVWFNGTGSVRSYTTAARYCWGLFLYTVVLVVGYCVLLIALIAGISATPHEDWVSVAPVAAFLLVAVIARLPLLAKARARVRGALHRAVGIPREAEQLADHLVRTEQALSETEKAEVTVYLQMHSYDPTEEEWLPVAEPMRALWFKTAALFQRIRRWPDDRRYCGFTQAAAGEWDVLRKRFDQLSLKVVRVLDTVERLGGLPVLSHEEAGRTREDTGEAADGADGIRRIVTDIVEDLREDIAFLHRNVCLFAARGVLAGSLTASGRGRRLVQLGFEPVPTKRSPVMALVLAWIAYCLVFGRSSMDARRVVMISTIMGISVAVAVLPKLLRFGFANEDLHGHTPWLFVLAAGLVAAALFVPVRSFFFDLSALFKTSASVAPLGPLSQNYPWLLPAFTTSATTAFLIQDSRWSRFPSSWMRRALDGLVLAVATTAGVFGSMWWLRHIPNPPAYPPQPALQALNLSVASGFIVGLLVPGRIRRQNISLGWSAMEGRMRALAGLAPMRRA